jgi:response regulator RpfG family c-di-GMP phosphodiesterase
MPHSPSCVAIVDDDDLVRAFFEDVLEEDGYICRSFSRGADALDAFALSGRLPDLILCDIRMHGMSGLEFLRALRAAEYETPVILISGHYDLPSALEAIGQGAADYLLKPASPEDILASVARNLTRRDRGAGTRAAAEAAFSLDLRNLDNRTDTRRIMELANSIAEKRIETLEHSSRVASYALLTGRAMSGVDLKKLEIGAFLHDIGKVGVPENVLNKPGRLNSEEWRIIKLHPAIGRDLLLPIAGMEGVAEMVYSHHENFNGTGYPRGLRSYDIGVYARIFAVVDTFDAITSDRPYRRARPVLAAKAELVRMAGSQFDPEVVENFLRIPDAAIDDVRRRHSELFTPADFSAAPDGPASTIVRQDFAVDHRF